jgi:hypothetical protein
MKNRFTLCCVILFLTYHSSIAQITLKQWNFNSNPTDGNTATGINTPNIGTGTITSIGGISQIFADGAGSSDPAVNADDSGYQTSGYPTQGAGDKTAGIQFLVSTVGYQDIILTWDQRHSNTASRYVQVQYTINGTDWIDFQVYDLVNAGTAVWVNTLTADFSAITTVENNANFGVRIVSTFAPSTTAYAPTNTGSTYNPATGTWRFDMITVTGTDAAQADLFFRPANASGNWSDIGSWETSTDQINWTPATLTPNFQAKNITIQNGQTLTLDVDVEIDQLTIEEGGTLVLANTNTLTFNNGVGTDLIVNGTLEDNATSGNGLSFDANATWSLGANGTILKTNNSTTVAYRDNYEGGMNNIPATAHWIIRYLGSGNPSFTTVGGSFYPNLTFESSSGNWNPGISTSRFSGSGDFATIKGNLDVGGTGIGTVNIYNQWNRF